MAAKTITSANSVFTLNIPGVLPGSITLEGYAVDEAFSTAALNLIEVRMGVDGQMTAGYTPKVTEITIKLMPDSDSIAVFDIWLGAVKASREVVYGSGLIVLPSVRKKILLVKGVLSDSQQFPDAKKVLEAQEFKTTWQAVYPQAA